MKKICFLLLQLSFFISEAQTNNIIDWINSNSIIIEDTSLNNDLIDFNKQVPQKFIDAQIYGFGEATHHSKDFFDIKTKFFKYLVEKQGVKIFMMEESYQAEKSVNEWISGGEGNRLTILEKFSLAPWHCNEIVDLLEWMRNYNQNKSKEEQIRFYGIDTQIGENLNDEIKEFIKSHNITIDDELIKAIDESVEKNRTGNPLIKLKEVERIIVEHQEEQNNDYTSVLRILNYLKNFTIYMQNPKTEVRDEQMFKNAVWIMDNIGQEEKVFIWAHNEHINKQGHSVRITNLGNLLKEKYADKYYSVGFDFGIGILPGVVIKKGKITGWEYYPLEKTYKNTFAETLYKADSEAFFIDMELAVNTESSSFFSKENRHLTLGASGFNPKNPVFIKRSYTDSYDGLIFVKKINPPTYKITE